MMAKFTNLEDKIDRINSGISRIQKDIHDHELERVDKFNKLDQALNKRIAKVEKDFAVFQARVYAIAAFIVVGVEVITKLFPKLYGG